MAASGVVVRDFHPADLDDAVRVLTDSFLGFPPLMVVVGSDTAAPGRLKRLFGMELEPGSPSAAIVAERDGMVVGVLTYVDRPDCTAASIGRTLRFLSVAGPRLLATLLLFRRVDQVHPRTPHRHLPSIGVDPSLQGSGVGAALMAEYTRGCDEAGLEGYLETIRWADPRRPSHARFYARAGFEVAAELPVARDWSIVTMRRPAGARG